MSVKLPASPSGAGAWPVLWTVPGILASAFLMTWGAEAAQFLIGRALALALLAWLQTLPELWVEAVIAWHAGEDPSRAPLAIANLTGAIRLLVGLGWPLVYVVHAVAGRRRGLARLPVVELAREHAVGVRALVPPLGYFAVILAKGSFTVVDGGVLAICYAGYLTLAARTPAADAPALATAPALSRWALARPGWRVAVRLGVVWAGGGLLLVATGGPFFTSMLAVAALLGIAPFFVVQWLAPVLTELPEMVSALSWARRVTSAPMALMNLVSSAVNQWTILAAVIPVAFGWAHWRRFGIWGPFIFDDTQRFEVLLALLQTAVGVALLARLEFGPGAAAGLFALWVLQVVAPPARPVVVGAYAAWLTVLTVLWATRHWSLGRGRPVGERAMNKTAGPAARDPADH